MLAKASRRVPLAVAAFFAVGFLLLGLWRPVFLFCILFAPVIYWWLRSKEVRRQRVMTQPFPPIWESILVHQVAYFCALSDREKQRFRKMVMVFLDETRITGIRTDVDDQTRVLVAASAIIPVFQFPDWEYRSLAEVLIYPDNFDDSYQSDGNGARDMLGMVGTGHLSGVMILSKPALISGFSITGDGNNVGIHEFAHLVDRADGSIDGIPPGAPPQLVAAWVRWVGQELTTESQTRSHVKPYAYTNEAEYFAVLVEYFFEQPLVLKRKNPELYRMMEKMFRQDTAALLRGVQRRPKRIGRNRLCPCGSGQKYKHCCLRSAKQGVLR
jgi:Mlc titration factor MtfA (ptsG expression regulator)